MFPCFRKANRASNVQHGYNKGETRARLLSPILEYENSKNEIRENSDLNGKQTKSEYGMK